MDAARRRARTLEQNSWFQSSLQYAGGDYFWPCEGALETVILDLGPFDSGQFDLGQLVVVCVSAVCVSAVCVSAVCVCLLKKIGQTPRKTTQP